MSEDGHLRKHFDEPLKIDDFARQLGMSVSGFHHHFKSVTAMSPLQFQKQKRLQEARRLMLGEDLDAASAGFRIGYEIRHTSAATIKSSSARRLSAISLACGLGCTLKDRSVFRYRKKFAEAIASLPALAMLESLPRFHSQPC